MASDQKTVKFSEKEINTMALAWLCLKDNPQPDIKKLAPLAGYTEGSCRNAWNAIRKKMAELSDGHTMVGTSGNSKGGAATATPNKRKPTTKKQTVTEDDDNGTAESPTKKTKRAAPKAKGGKGGKVKPEENDTGMDEKAGIKMEDLANEDEEVV